MNIGDFFQKHKKNLTDAFEQLCMYDLSSREYTVGNVGIRDKCMDIIIFSPPVQPWLQEQ